MFQKFDHSSLPTWIAKQIKKLREDNCTKNEVFHEGFLQQMWPSPQFPVDLVTFIEEILNEKLHFLYSETTACGIFFHKVLVSPNPWAA